MRKYIISIFILLSICFININVSAVEYYDSNEEIINAAAEIFRDKMINKEESFEIQTEYIAQKDERFNPNDYIKKVYEKAISEEFSNNSSAGGYLEWSLLSFGYSARIKSTVTLDDGSIGYVLRLKGNFTYYITKEKENRLNVQIQNWVNNNIDLQNDTDFEKIFKIYKFIIENVKYDDTLTKRTAYEAFFDGSSVCQGYATLFYKMCKIANIENVWVLAGSTGAPYYQPHGWNAVQLDGKRYYLDPTWDAGSSPWLYFFLRGAKGFEPVHIGTIPENMQVDDYPFINVEEIKLNTNSRQINGFDLSNGTISKDTFLKKLSSNQDKINIRIEQSKEQEVIGTGNSVVLEKDNIILAEYGIVIYGDINGDGEISAVDALYLIKGINGSIYYEATYQVEAGRIITSGKDRPKAVDALAIIKHVNGKYAINQSK